MTHPKFIISLRGYFRMGMVHLHEELLKGGEHCIGGGYFDIDANGKKILLYGKSYDFGPPLWNMIDTLKVPKEYAGYSILYKSDECPEDETDVTSMLDVEYVDS